MISTYSFKTVQRRWTAVLERDPAADGNFWYAVKTTGVYCRPICRSRMPRRENVQFFDTPAAAEWDGFRACRRCRPNEVANAPPHGDAILQACRRIEIAKDAPSLRELAGQAGLSPYHFQRVFKRVVGVSPKQYAIANRANRFRSELRKAQSVTDAIYDAGFNSSSRAYDGIRARIGMKPSVFRQGGRGVTVHYTVVSTSLGPVLVVATETGICSIEFGDDTRALTAEVARLFPNAERREGGRAVERFAAAIIRFVAQPQHELQLPLDIQGTAFQQRVWQALRRIPAGKTVAYKDLAVAVGSPRATRAVGQACAQNRLALAIPCHRVVRSTGEQGGYRWGIERKRKLLAREFESLRKEAPSSQ